jgi:hypothetical protein
MARRAPVRRVRRLLLELHQRLRKCVACLERTKSYCCFNPHLARIINEQGRAQVGKGWGSDTARNRLQWLQRGSVASLDFSRMDLSEFYAEITPTILNRARPPATPPRVPACYFGNGIAGTRVRDALAAGVTMTVPPSLQSLCSRSPHRGGRRRPSSGDHRQAAPGDRDRPGERMACWSARRRKHRAGVRRHGTDRDRRDDSPGAGGTGCKRLAVTTSQDGVRLQPRERESIRRKAFTAAQLLP